jgi:hypothetical protein
MSAHHLPDDLRRWPRDPYQVLGVAPRCDPLVARKAYTGLIRHFKPERFPEHFRLIREAYDTIKRDAPFFGMISTTAPADQGAADDALAGTRTPTADSAAVVPPSGPDPLQHRDSVEAWWRRACDGEAEEAYRRLRQMYEINPQNSELPARLYALLLAYPGLDMRNTPCDWLVRGVPADVPWGPCRQLYRREIDDRPDEALSERFAGLLDDGTLPRNLIDFLAWRWEALLRLGRIDLIPGDLARAARRLERQDEEGWVRVLLKAADYLAWEKGSHFDDLCAEIEGHVHVHGALGEDLARLDFLRELSRSWNGLRTQWIREMPLLGVVPLTWTSPFENRQRIVAKCRYLAEHAEQALAALDDLQRCAPLLSAHLGQALSWLYYSHGDPRDESALRSAVNDCFRDLRPPLGEHDYALYRPYLLQFCLAEAIAPETAAHVLGPMQAPFAFQRILDDWPLRTVCSAHRLIWS